MPALGTGDVDTPVRRAPASSDRFGYPRRAGSLLCSLLFHALIVALLVGQVSNASQDERETADPIVVDLSVPSVVESFPHEAELPPEVDTASAAPDDPMGDLGDARSAAPVEACTDEAPGQGPPVQTIAEWRRELQLHFARFRKFPAEALMNRLEGTTLVFVTVCRNGRVQQAHIIRSSGVDILDQASLQLVQSASPLPVLPDSHPGQSIDVVLPVEFSVARH